MTQLRFDRIFENSTTTGSGAYALSGTVGTNYTTFSSTGAATGDTFEYSVEDLTNGGYETGLGTYDSVANAITRTTIYSSSNGNVAVAWVAGTRRIAMSITATTMSTVTSSLLLISTAIVNTQNSLVKATT